VEGVLVDRNAGLETLLVDKIRRVVRCLLVTESFCRSSLFRIMWYFWFGSSYRVTIEARGSTQRSIGVAGASGELLASSAPFAWVAAENASRPGTLAALQGFDWAGRRGSDANGGYRLNDAVVAVVVLQCDGCIFVDLDKQLGVAVLFAVRVEKREVAVALLQAVELCGEGGEQGVVGVGAATIGGVPDSPAYEDEARVLGFYGHLDRLIEDRIEAVAFDDPGTLAQRRSNA
jgi:hypothetical protein